MITDPITFRMRDDLELAARTLRRYEDMHRAKPVTLETMGKADANAALAKRFEDTLRDFDGAQVGIAPPPTYTHAEMSRVLDGLSVQAKTFGLEVVAGLAGGLGLRAINDALPCGHHPSLMLKSAETGKDLYCELCDTLDRRNDAEQCEADLRADLVEERNRIADMRTAWGVEANDLTARARHAEDCLEAAKARIAELEAKLNTPQLHNFAEAVVLEAAHQRELWPDSRDVGKQPSDWFWLVGHLAGKALHAAMAGNKDKTAHHTISTAAALANWHAFVTGEYTGFRAGIDPVARGIEPNASAAPRDTAAMLAEHLQLADDYCFCNGGTNSVATHRAAVEASARKLLGEAS